MEIDFLGLNSPSCQSDQQIPSDPSKDAGVEISLSLATTSSLNFSQTRKKWEFAAPPVSRHSAAGGEFIYDNLRNMSKPPTILYPKPQKAHQNEALYISGNGDNSLMVTVAMARRATLARFLEKRLHRRNNIIVKPN